MSTTGSTRRSIASSKAGSRSGWRAARITRPSARHCSSSARSSTSSQAATLAASLPLQAQQATQPDPQAKELDAVKVTAPNLSSQAESIAIQREAVNVATAISADAVGDFPDQTAAAALSRAFRFDAVPANVIDVVTINKTLTPAMPSEALAGRVNIETVSPMAQRGFHTSD